MPSPSGRWIRSLLVLALENLCTSVLIGSGILLFIAHALTYCVQVFCVQLLIGSGFSIYKGGYPGGVDWEDMLFLTGLSLVTQYLMVRLAVRHVSRRLKRNSRFLFDVWKKVYCHGVPLIAIVLVYDVLTVSFDIRVLDFFVLSCWTVYLYLASLLFARRRVAFRARRICPLCPQCGYWLFPKVSANCPECGRPIQQ